MTQGVKTLYYFKNGKIAWKEEEYVYYTDKKGQKHYRRKRRKDKSKPGKRQTVPSDDLVRARVQKWV